MSNEFFLIIDNFDTIEMSKIEIQSHIDFCKRYNVWYYESANMFQFRGNEPQDDMNALYLYLTDRGFKCSKYKAFDTGRMKKLKKLSNTWYQLTINDVQPEVGFVIEMELANIYQKNNGKIIDKDNMRFETKRECLNMSNAFQKYGFSCAIIERMENGT